MIDVGLGSILFLYIYTDCAKKVFSEKLPSSSQLQMCNAGNLTETQRRNGVGVARGESPLLQHKRDLVPPEKGQRETLCVSCVVGETQAAELSRGWVLIPICQRGEVGHP